METLKRIVVEVAYAKPEKQQILSIEVPEGTTLSRAILASGILTIFPEIDLSKQKVGIFGQQKKLSDRVGAGDRVEIYRPLLIDPKEARRKRTEESRF